MSKSNRSIPPACKYAEAASAEPQFQCSCAAQERTRKKLSRLPVGESARIIEGSSWQPCTTSLALKSGSLGVKTQRVPTIFEIWKSRFQHAQFTLRQWQCCLVLLPFLPFTFHGRKQQTLILWRLGSKINLFPCRTSCEKNRVTPILGFIKHGASFIKSKRPVTMFRQNCRHHQSRSQPKSFHTFRGVCLCVSESSKWTQGTQNTGAPPELWRRCGRNDGCGVSSNQGGGGIIESPVDMFVSSRDGETCMGGNGTCCGMITGVSCSVEIHGVSGS